MYDATVAGVAPREWTFYLVIALIWGLIQMFAPFQNR